MKEGKQTGNGMAADGPVGSIGLIRHCNLSVLWDFSGCICVWIELVDLTQIQF